MSLTKKNLKKFEEISGWGSYPKKFTIKRKPKTIKELQKLIKNKPLIARGNGRSYGDSSYNQSNTLEMLEFNRLLYFNNKSGLVIAESGVLLEEIINIFLPKGWFPFVTPGSKYVTIGGMVAADVHGKNHYKDGSFSNYIKWIEIINHEGKIIKCSRKKNIKLFNWTIGGMGLTGIILKIAFFLKPLNSSWIKQKTYVSNNIAKTIEIFESKINSTYLVAWIDTCAKGNSLGRSLITIGEHADYNDLNLANKKNIFYIKKKKKLTIPFYFPKFIFNKFSIKIFNYMYYLRGKFSKKVKIIDWDTFFYPLDGLLNWNRIYGNNGFAQFQCIIPLSKSKQGIFELLECISKSKSTSYLAVLKRFGKDKSFFSFPMEGYSLALDFPINNKNLKLMKALDEITIKHEGRFYLAKDSRMKKETFQKSDKRIKDFKRYRKGKSKNSFSSSQSKRLGI